MTGGTGHLAASPSEGKREEVTATQAFLVSFVFFSLILAPVLGLGLYFARSMEFVAESFVTREGTFLGGMAVGVAAAFVIALIFTRRAVASS